MASMMIALLLTVWTLPQQGEAQGLSDNMVRFLYINSGIYDNLAQYQAENTTYDYTQLRSIPVTTPAIPGKTVLFIEWAYNGVVLNLYLADPSDDIFGGITLALYNFTTDPSQYKPGEYKVEDLLSKLTPADVQPRLPYSEAEFRNNGIDRFVGTWPECRYYFNGRPVLYRVDSTCNKMDVLMPPVSKEKLTTLPYDLVLKGDKYKVPGAPTSFVYPCS